MGKLKFAIIDLQIQIDPLIIEHSHDTPNNLFLFGFVLIAQNFKKIRRHALQGQTDVKVEIVFQIDFFQKIYPFLTQQFLVRLMISKQYNSCFLKKDHTKLFKIFWSLNFKRQKRRIFKPTVLIWIPSCDICTLNCIRSVQRQASKPNQKLRLWKGLRNILAWHINSAITKQQQGDTIVILIPPAGTVLPF